MFGLLYNLFFKKPKEYYSRPSMERDDFVSFVHEYLQSKHSCDDYNVVMKLLNAYDNYEIEYDVNDIEAYLKNIL